MKKNVAIVVLSLVCVVFGVRDVMRVLRRAAAADAGTGSPTIGMPDTESARVTALNDRVKALERALTRKDEELTRARASVGRRDGPDAPASALPLWDHPDEPIGGTAGTPDRTNARTISPPGDAGLRGGDMLQDTNVTVPSKATVEQE